MNNDTVITWIRPMLERFKRSYQRVRAVEAETGEKVASFTFDGHDFVPDYAKYLIEYLETVL